MIHIETIGSRIRIIRKLNRINQVDFSNRIGISQATLSELEQDKYKPSVDTILAIVEGFEVDVEWILLGSKSFKGNVFGISGVNEKEANVLLQFEKLKASDQDEIIDFIKLKISRWLKTIMSDREFWVTNSVRLQNRIVYTLVSLERTGSLSEIEHSRAV